MSEGNLPNGAAARLEAVQDGKPWIKRFTKKEYAQAFAEYTARFGPLYEAALAKPESLPALAEELLDGIAAGWQRQRPWNRTVALMNDKQMLVTYLSPHAAKAGRRRGSGGPDSGRLGRPLAQGRLSERQL